MEGWLCLLCDCAPGVIRLQDLDIGVVFLNACLKILAAPKATDEENALDNVSSLLPASSGRKCGMLSTRLNSQSRTLDLHGFDLIVDKTEDVRYQGREYVLQIVSVSVGHPYISFPCATSDSHAGPVGRLTGSFATYLTQDQRPRRPPSLPWGS